MGYKEDVLSVYDEEHLKMNPYYEAFKSSGWPNVHSYGTDFIEWEATQQYYQQQLADQRALRNEERAYNDPKSQVERLRAAGINPDLDGASSLSGSGSGSGSTSVPSPAQWKGHVPTTMQDIHALAGVVQSSIASLGQIGQLARSFVDFSKDVSLYDESIAIGQAAARRATYDADLSKLSTIGKYAEYLPQDTDLSSVDIDKFAKDLFIEDPQIIDGLKHYVGSSEGQRIYYDMQLKARQAKHRNIVFNPEVFAQTLSDQQEADRTESLTKKITSNYLSYYAVARYGLPESSFDEDGNVINDAALQGEFDRQMALNESQIGQNLSEAGLMDSEASITAAADNLKMSNVQSILNDRQREIYVKQLGHVAQLAQRALDSAKNLLSEDMTNEEYSLYSYYLSTYYRMMTLGQDSLDKVYDLYDEFTRREYLRGAMLDKNGHVDFISTEINTKQLDFIDRVSFREVIGANSPVDKLTSALSSLKNLIPSKKKD